MYPTKKLSELATLFTDWDWIESKDQSESWVRLIQTGNVWMGYFKDRWEKARYISWKTFDKLKCIEIFEWDILVSRLPDPVWRSCIIPDTWERMITAVDCTIIRLNKEKIASDFFNYYSQSDKYLTDVENETSWTTRKRISRKNLWEIQIPLPPLSTQLDIVARLDSAMAEIESLRRETVSALTSTRELWESTLESVFASGGKDLEEKRFDEICVLQRWYDLPTHARKEGKFPLVSSNGITDRINEYKVKSPWVVTWRSWTIGNIHFIEEDFWPLNTALYIKDFHGNNEKCVYYFLKQFDLIKYSSGAGVPTLNRNNVHCVMISFPPLSEQSRIVAHLDAVRAETERLEKLYTEKLASLDELKKSILQEAFS